MIAPNPIPNIIKTITAVPKEIPKVLIFKRYTYIFTVGWVPVDPNSVPLVGAAVGKNVGAAVGSDIREIRTNDYLMPELDNCTATL